MPLLSSNGDKIGHRQTAGQSGWSGSRSRAHNPSGTRTTPARLLPLRHIKPRNSHQAVELARVLARDLADHIGRQVAELLLDVLRRLGPHAVGVRIVRGPHDRFLTHVLDELGADPVELERGLALAPPVVARLHREAEVAEAILPLEVHAIERVGDPADATLAERDPEARMALE